MQISEPHFVTGFTATPQKLIMPFCGCSRSRPRQLRICDVGFELIRSLRKTKTDGTPYTRPDEIEARLEQLQKLPVPEQVRQCKIKAEDETEFVPPECVVYLMRNRRDFDRDDETAKALYEILFERVLGQLPWTEQEGCPKQLATAVAVREQVAERFAEMMAIDRESYVEQLDLYEARFAFSVARLRATARKKAFKHANRQKPLDMIEASGEMSRPEEIQLEISNSSIFDELHEKDYRRRYSEAIVHLPDDLRIVIELYREGVPFESSDPEKLTISRVIERTPKTARDYRDQAFAILRGILLEEDQ